MYALMKVAHEMDQRKISKDEINKYIDHYFACSEEGRSGCQSNEHSFIDPSDFEENSEEYKDNMNTDAINSQVLELDDSADELLEGIIKRHKTRSELATTSGLGPTVLPKVNRIQDIFTGFAPIYRNQANNN